MDIEIWFQKALSGVEQTPQNMVFLVKELFQGTEWNSLDKGDKLRFGSYFKNAVLSGDVPNVTYVGKAENNSAKYKKTEEI